MKLERIIAVRTSKTVYRDGNLCVKVFGDEYAKSRILAEATTHAKIEETGLDVPKILEVTKAEGKWAIVSEFIAGHTLERLMDEEPEKRGEYMSRFVDAQLRINSTKARGLAKLKERVEEMLRLVGLEEYRNYYPGQLSASMLQRVSIARAFAVQPELLLMDEPYGQLDNSLRYKLEDELISLWQRIGTTVIFITHNIEEAVYLSERILVLTNKPTGIKKEIRNDLSRPRDVTGAAFNELRDEVTDLIKWW